MKTWDFLSVYPGACVPSISSVNCSGHVGLDIYKLWVFAVINFGLSTSADITGIFSLYPRLEDGRHIPSNIQSFSPPSFKLATSSPFTLLLLAAGTYDLMVQWQ